MSQKQIQGAMGQFRGTVRVVPPWEWLTASGLALGVLVSGYVGFARLFEARGIAWDVLEPLNLSVSLFFAKFPPELGHDIPLPLQVTRLIAPWVLALGLVWTFVRTSVWRLQHLRLALMRGHVVVLGLDGRAVALAEDARAAGLRVVVVDVAGRADELDACRRMGALVVAGSVADARVLKFAGVTRAARVVVFGEDDAAVLEAAVAACGLLEGAGERVTVHACLRDAALLDRVTARPEALGVGGRRLRLFSEGSLAARAVLERFPLDFEGVAPGSAQHVHLVIAGASALGQAAASLAARVGHYANGQSVTVWLIDAAADVVLERWRGAEPGLASAVNVQAVRADPLTPKAWEGVQAALVDGHGLTTVLVAAAGADGDGGGVPVSRALSVPMLHGRARVLVAAPGCPGLAERLRGGGLYVVDPERLAFTMAHVALERLDRLARAAHEHYVRGRRAEGTLNPSEPSHRAWDELPGAFRTANRAQADHIWVKARALGLEIVVGSETGAATPEPMVEALAACEHERWNAERELAGWSFGPVKDTERKRTPYLVEYAALPEDIKEWDRRAVRSIPDLLHGAGLAWRPAGGETGQGAGQSAGQGAASMKTSTA